MMLGSKGLTPHELSHKWMKDLGLRPDMEQNIQWMFVLLRPKRSVGIIITCRVSLETEWREYMTTKKQNIAVIAVFLCMVFGMTIWTMVTPSREFSERENRALAQMPEPSVESCFSGKFEKDFETYLTDQFPMRDGWISAKTAIEKATLKTESKDIYFADDDYLIEAHSKSFTAPSANANIGYLKNFMETCVETYGKDHATAMVVPNAVDILRDHLPKYASPYDEEVYLQKVADAMPEGTWFDSGSVLREHKNIQLYYRTDHHWTTEAAYYVYAAWAEEKGLSPLALSDYKKKTLTDGFFGTVDAKVGGRNRSDTIHVYIPKKKEKYQVNYVAKNETADDIYQYDYLKIRDKYSVYFGGNQSLVEVKTDSKSKRKLLVVQDSYAHCFIPFTLHDFKEVDFVDLRYYSESLKEYMEKGDYTDVLFLYNAAGFAEDNSLIKLGN